MSRGTEARILQELEEWEKKEGGLPSFVELYRQLLQMQSEAKSDTTVTRPSLAQDVIHDRLGEGIPLLLFSDFSPDWGQLQAVFEKIASWAAKDSEDASGELERLRNIARDGSLLREIVGTWYQMQPLTDIATEQGIESELLTSVVEATLKPFLSAYSELLLPEVRQESWRRGYCPVCGGRPDFAYMDKERGARWLLCSRCDAEWLFVRLQCPYCGTQDQDALAYFADEESHLYRLYVCERCRTYIKAIDLRHTESEVPLPLERVMTLDMDRQGQEKGYKPGWATRQP